MNELDDFKKALSQLDKVAGVHSFVYMGATGSGTVFTYDDTKVFFFSCIDDFIFEMKKCVELGISVDDKYHRI